ncbi:MAG TPA: PEP-CTERM sorting domain-containing protein [Dongiaceae bacterium]|nr:PEP-CTERM sorting domain-containing protein [Dongiaceae bacterium]
MRNAMQNLLGATCLMLAVQAAQAVPVNYVFNGTSVGEFNAANGPVATTIYSGTTSISGGFTYDDAAPVLGLSPVQGYNGALFTTYNGGFSDFSLTVAGQTATVDQGVGLVGNNVAITGTVTPIDVLLGYADSAYPTAGFSGFQVGNWILSSLAFVFFNNSSAYADASLPDTLTANSTALEMFYTNTTGQVQKVRYFLNAVTEVPVDVPEPPVFLLTALGMAGLWLRRRMDRA